MSPHYDCLASTHVPLRHRLHGERENERKNKGIDHMIERGARWECALHIESRRGEVQIKKKLESDYALLSTGKCALSTPRAVGYVCVHGQKIQFERSAEM